MNWTEDLREFLNSQARARFPEGSFPDSRGSLERVPALLEALAGRGSNDQVEAAARARCTLEAWAAIQLRRALNVGGTGWVPAALPAVPALLALAPRSKAALRLLAGVRETAAYPDGTSDAGREEFRQRILAAFREGLPLLVEMVARDDEMAVAAIGILVRCDDAADLVWTRCEAHFAASGAALLAAARLDGLSAERRDRARTAALVLLDRLRGEPGFTYGTSCAAFALLELGVTGAEQERALEALFAEMDGGWYLRMQRWSGPDAWSVLAGLVKATDVAERVLAVATRALARGDVSARLTILDRLLQLELGEPAMTLVNGYAPWGDPAAAEKLRDLLDVHALLERFGARLGS